MEDIEDIVMIFGIFAGIFLLLGSTFLIIGLIRYLPTRHWDQVEGVFIEKEKKYHFSLDTIFNNRSVRVHYPDAKPTFQYEVEGQLYVKASNSDQALQSVLSLMFYITLSLHKKL